MSKNDHQTVGPSTDRFQTYPRWPVAILAAAAYVAIWGGWVELGRMCGFGPVNLLPGITNFEVDLAITLPLGMEVYAAYAMGAWLTKKHIDSSARTFAKVSTFVSLAIGTSGQIAYHLLSAAGIEKAPWPVVMGVACVSVAVLGMASMLAHRLHVPTGRSDAHSARLEQPGDDDDARQEVDPQDEDDESGLIPMPWVEVAETDRPTGHRRRPVTADERAEILRLTQSLSEREVARRMKRSRDTIRRVLADARKLTPVAPADRPTTEATWPQTVPA